MSLSKSFTLIETMVAITILTVGILGSYLVFYNLYNQSGGISYNLEASYLAQEGIEIIRNMRDNNWIKYPTSMWLKNIIADNNCINGCNLQADYKTGTANYVTGLIPYGTDGNFLSIDSDGMYSYNPSCQDESCQTIFKRKITITTGSSDAFFGSSDMFQVDSTVTWKYKGKDFFVKITEFLYNWYGK